MHVVVALAEPHCRSNPQRESQAGDAHTPLIHSFPNAHALLQRPQLSTSVLVSWQLPSSQSSTPGPKQRVGPDVGLVVDVVSVADVIAPVASIDEPRADEEDVVLFADDEVLLAHMLESGQAEVILLQDDELLAVDVVGMLLLKDSDADSVLLAEIVGILLLVVSNHPERVLLTEVVATLLLVVLSHPEKVLLAEAVGIPLVVLLKKPEVLLEGVADNVVSTEELVKVMDEDKLTVLLVPALPSKLVGELLATTEELSEVIDRLLDVLGSLGEPTGVEALVDSADNVEDISVLDDDVARLENELYVPLVDVELHSTSLDVPLDKEEDWAMFDDVEIPSDEDGDATGQEVPVVAIVVSVVVAVAVTVYRNQISLLLNLVTRDSRSQDK